MAKTERQIAIKHLYVCVSLCTALTHTDVVVISHSFLAAQYQMTEKEMSVCSTETLFFECWGYRYRDSKILGIFGGERLSENL